MIALLLLTIPLALFIAIPAVTLEIVNFTIVLISMWQFRRGPRL